MRRFSGCHFSETSRIRMMRRRFPTTVHTKRSLAIVPHHCKMMIPSVPEVAALVLNAPIPPLPAVPRSGSVELPGDVPQPLFVVDPRLVPPAPPPPLPAAPLVPPVVPPSAPPLYPALPPAKLKESPSPAERTTKLVRSENRVFHHLPSKGKWLVMRRLSFSDCYLGNSPRLL